MKTIGALFLIFVIFNFQFYLISGYFWHTIKDIKYNLQHWKEPPKYHSLKLIIYDSFLGGNPYVKFVKWVLGRLHSKRDDHRSTPHW